RSAQRGAMRGGPSRKALAVIRKSGKAAAAPKVRWPLAFTNTESNACPQTLKEKGRKSSTKPSSPTGRGSPGRNALKTTFTPDTASAKGSARLRAMTFTPVRGVVPFGARILPVMDADPAKKPAAGYRVERIDTSSASRVCDPEPGPK